MKQINFTTQKRKLGDLIPASYNPRKMTEKQNEDLKKSLEKFSLAEIPVINTDNIILAGHQRIRILVDLHGRDYEIDVRVPDRTLTEAECKEYNIRSNKNTGQWDWDILGNQFEPTELGEWGFESWELGGHETETELNIPQEFIDENFSAKEKNKKEITCPECKHLFIL